MLKYLGGAILSLSLCAAPDAPSSVIQQLMDVEPGRGRRGIREALRIVYRYADEHGNNNGRLELNEYEAAKPLLRQELTDFMDTNDDGRVSVQEEIDYYYNYSERPGYIVLQRMLQ